MKPTIFIIEDNAKILYNLELLLEFNGYRPIGAKNGIEAFNMLSELDEPPDLFLCDIMMPEMDGYEFFSRVSDNPAWSFIPFIFLTAKASPEDVRFGKILGVDDYITKPFNDKDLLSSIAGKIQRSIKNKELGKQIEKNLLTSLRNELGSSMTPSERGEVILFNVIWDEAYGPKVRDIFPSDSNTKFDLRQLGTQLFQTAVSVYGQLDYYEPQGVLLRIANIDRDGYIYFDTIEDPEVRGGKRQFMIVLLAQKINYLASLRIKEEFEKMATDYKHGNQFSENLNWDNFVKILSTTSSNLR
ncbi:MAG: PleD family two-component system response regulator [Candidatus Thorarchaeota archaeon]